MDLIVAARPGTVVEMYPTTDIIKFGFVETIKI